MSPRNFSLLSIRIEITFIVLVTILGCSSPSTPTEQPTSTPTLSPTDVPTLTPSPSPTATVVPAPLQTFSLENADTTPPDEVFEEVSYSTAGGGGGPSDCPYAGENIRIGLNATEYTDWLTPVKIKACGWTKNEKITITIETPDGKTMTDIGEAHLPIVVEGSDTFRIIDWYIYYEYQPEEGVVGRYKFTFSGESGSITHSAYITSPDLRMEYGRVNETYHFYGFLPNESVRIFIYESLMPGDEGFIEGRVTNRFVAWKEFSANAQGKLSLELSDISHSTIIAVGDTSGVIQGEYQFSNILKVNLNGSCVANAWIYPQVIPTRLETGMFAYVSMDPPQSNRLRSGPGTDNKIVDRINAGTVIQVIDGPECIDGANWWKVKGVDRDFEGWTSEGDEEYWLVPCYKKLNEACPE